MVKLSPAVITPVLSLHKGILLVQKAMLNMKTNADSANGSVGAATRGMGKTSTAAGTSTGKLKGMRRAMSLLNATMRANPIGAVITALGFLVTAGIAVYENWDTIKKKASELWDFISDVFGKIGGAISGAWGLLHEFLTYKGGQDNVCKNRYY